jgi:hypothetical protein
MKNSFKSFILLILTVVIISTFNFSAAATDKLKPEEIIAKHLDSIGTKEKRAEIKNQVVLCNLELTVRGAATPVSGQAVFASSSEKSIWGMNFSSNDYPMDKYSFNGKDTKIGFVRPGVRSVLGEFIYNYKELIREGLLGGTLSTAWALNYTNQKNPKLSYDGEKKIEGKDTYVLDYSPKGGSDLSIKMYFDQKTFQHLRTEYNRVISARISTTGNGQGDARINASAGQGSDRYKLVEDFSDFQKVNGITIPGKYKLYYSYFSDTVAQSAQKKNSEVEWKFTVTNASFNQALDDNSFEIAGS